MSIRNPAVQRIAQSNYEYYNNLHRLEEVLYTEGKRSPRTFAATFGRGSHDKQIAPMASSAPQELRAESELGCHPRTTSPQNLEVGTASVKPELAVRRPKFVVWIV